MKDQILLFMAAVGAVILLISCAVKGKMEGLLTFLMRGLLGIVGIHFANLLFLQWGFSLGIGVNIYTFLVISFLGIPGFLGLYVLAFFHLL